MADGTTTDQKSRHQTFLASVLANWHFMRWLRLAIGLFLSWQMVQSPDVFTGLIAGVFLFQAITWRQSGVVNAAHLESIIKQFSETPANI